MELAEPGEHIVPVTVITPPSGWQVLDLRELKQYRDLFFFLVRRDVKSRYAQTVLGFGWAILQPLIQILLFSIVFGKVAQIYTEGIPYLLFSTVAIVPWTYMSSAMSDSSQSLVGGQSMLGKIYFPRLLFPITPILTNLVDFAISLVIVIGVGAFYRVPPTLNLIYLPLFLGMMMTVPLAIGFWFSSLSIRFRDVRFVMQFVVRMAMFSAPIVYSASTIPTAYRFVYSLNPIVGVIEGFRASVLGTPIPWASVVPGMIVALMLLVSGAFYFKRMERVVVDVI